jgi:DNA transposition AAA+ family ATPase
MLKSIRQIEREAGISHGAIGKILKGKYKANPKNIFEKILGSIGGVNIPPDRYDEILEMLDNARLPQKFQAAHRTASWLYDLVTTAKKTDKEKRAQNDMSL